MDLTGIIAFTALVACFQIYAWFQNIGGGWRKYLGLALCVVLLLSVYKYDLAENYTPEVALRSAKWVAGAGEEFISAVSKFTLNVSVDLISDLAKAVWKNTTGGGEDMDQKSGNECKDPKKENDAGGDNEAGPFVLFHVRVKKSSDGIYTKVQMAPMMWSLFYAAISLAALGIGGGALLRFVEIFN